MSKTNENKILQISEDGLTVEKCLNKTIKSITIPEKITTIDEFAFFECKNLKRITFPDSLRYIYAFAFRGCCNLELLDFSKTELRNIGTAAFECCHNLSRVYFPESISSINNCAFEKCNNLSDITSLPQKAIDIADNAFEGCPISDFTHQSLKIKNNLVIKDNCVTGITSVKPCFELKVPDGIDTIQKSAVSDDEISELHINEGIKIIKTESILCEALLLVTVPSSLKKLSENAFGEDCIPPVIVNNSNIKMHFKGTTVLNYDENVKYSVRDEKFVIGTSDNEILLVYACPDYSHYEIEIPSDVTKIEYNALRDCKEHYITLPDSFVLDTEPEWRDEEQECIYGKKKFLLPSFAKIDRNFSAE